MLKKEFIEQMKNDSELRELRQKVYAITGNHEDIVFHIGARYTYEEWKDQLRKIIKEHEATSQQ